MCNCCELPPDSSEWCTAQADEDSPDDVFDELIDKSQIEAGICRFLMNRDGGQSFGNISLIYCTYLERYYYAAD